MISSTTLRHTDYESYIIIYPYLPHIKATDWLLLIVFSFWGECDKIQMYFVDSTVTATSRLKINFTEEDIWFSI